MNRSNPSNPFFIFQPYLALQRIYKNIHQENDEIFYYSISRQLPRFYNTSQSIITRIANLPPISVFRGHPGNTVDPHPNPIFFHWFVQYSYQGRGWPKGGSRCGRLGGGGSRDWRDGAWRGEANVINYPSNDSDWWAAGQVRPGRNSVEVVTASNYHLGRLISICSLASVAVSWVTSSRQYYVFILPVIYRWPVMQSGFFLSPPLLWWYKRMTACILRRGCNRKTVINSEWMDPVNYAASSWFPFIFFSVPRLSSVEI